MDEQRRLTTVLFADIVGYTSLMQSDEKLAMLYLNHFKELVDDTVPQYKGEIIQYYGDAVLLTFGSASAGVDCAIKLQRAFIEKEIPLRIGMHLGDVIFKNQNVFGDGVNIASRIESMGISGSILISKTTRDQLVNKGDYLLQSLGYFEFKNVEEPMELFAIANKGLAVPKRRQINDKMKASGKKPQNKWMVPVFLLGAMLLVEVFNIIIDRYHLDPVLLDFLIIIAVFAFPATLIYSFFKGRFNKLAIGLQVLNGFSTLGVLFYFVANPLALDPGKLRLIKLYKGKSSALEKLNSVAILPFSNNMGDDSQAPLLAGMHDGLINEIGRLGSIHIISRTSTLPYQNSSKGIQKIASELAVDAILEASVTRVDSMIELRINLINAFPEELVVWNDAYSSSIGELPNLYKEVTKNVALKINNVLLPEEAKKLVPKRATKPGAYEAFLRGTYYMGFLTPEGLDLAKEQFLQSIEIDSLFGPAYSGVSGVLGSQRQMGYVSSRTVEPVIDSLQYKAYELDSTDAQIVMGRAAHLTWSKFEWKRAEKLFKESIDINPNEPNTRTYYAHYLMIQNRWDEAWDQMELAIELDPQNPWVVAFSAAMYFHEGKIFSAGKQSARLVQIAPNHPMANLMFLGKYVFQKNYDLATVELKKFVKTTGVPDLDSFIDRAYQKNDFNAMIEKLAGHLEDHAEHQFISPNIIHFLYQLVKNQDKRLEWIVKMFESNDSNLPYFAIRNNDPIQQDPTYVGIMEEIGLW